MARVWCGWLFPPPHRVHVSPLEIAQKISLSSWIENGHASLRVESVGRQRSAHGQPNNSMDALSLLCCTNNNYSYRARKILIIQPSLLNKCLPHLSNNYISKYFRISFLFAFILIFIIGATTYKRSPLHASVLVGNSQCRWSTSSHANARGCCYLVSDQSMPLPTHPSNQQLIFLPTSFLPRYYECTLHNMGCKSDPIWTINICLGSMVTIEISDTAAY